MPIFTYRTAVELNQKTTNNLISLQKFYTALKPDLKKVSHKEIISIAINSLAEKKIKRDESEG